MLMTIKELADLLVATGHAHHQAFLASDGADPEWPLWYANYLHDKLNAAFKHDFTQSEIVYLLVKLDKEYVEQNPATSWSEYYAQFLVETCGA